MSEAGSFDILHSGPYSLHSQNRYFGGWSGIPDRDGASVMPFPVEGGGSAAVVVTQSDDGVVHGTVTGSGDAQAAWTQAAQTLSLDVDGSGYPAVGERDHVIGELQQQHDYLRPVLFNSPYEAACSFIIGHRISMVQGRKIRAAIAERFGETLTAGSITVHAFPTPERLRELHDLPRVNAERCERLHAVAGAAIDGWLTRSSLRDMEPAAARERVRSLAGVGPFFAEGIVLRGSGVVDEVPSDDITPAGVARFYGLPAVPDREEMTRIAEAWRPYRTWCSVLVHASERRSRSR